MAWIKRNLWFVVTIAVGLGLTGYCAYLLYGAIQSNAALKDDYTSKTQQLQQLESTQPYPSRENIQLAKEDQAHVQEFLNEFRTKFAPFPTPPVKDEKGFANYLIDKISQFRADATNAGVEIPFNYGFSFTALIGKLSYPPGNIQPWMQQLQEIERILGVVFRAKVTYLSVIKRCPVSADDASLADCLQTTPVTNQWGIVAPYQIVFRGFSADLAAVLDGFARASNCFIVKTVQVAPDTTVQMPQPTATPNPQPQPVIQYRQPTPQYNTPVPGLRGLARGGIPPPVFRPPVAAPVAVQPNAAALNQPPITVLSETPLSITITVDAVKLKVAEP